MIVDVFLFNDEYSMLSCRMWELDGIADLHVAIEGNLTMSGQQKPYRLESAGKLRVVHADISDLSRVTESTHGQPSRYVDHWKRDWLQRELGAQALDVMPDISDDTVVIYGDVDEIPKREAMESYLGDEPKRMIQELLIFSIGWTGGKWSGSIIGRKGDLETYPEVRRVREHYPMLQDGGWHLSWFGGEEAVVAKAKMFAHGELMEDIPRLRRQYQDRQWPGEGKLLTRYTGSLPRMVRAGLAPDSWL